MPAIPSQPSHAPCGPSGLPGLPGLLALPGVLAILLAACATTAPDTLRQRQAELLTRLGFQQAADDDWMLSLPGRITFAFDNDQLQDDSRRRIAGLATQLLAVDIRRLRVEGHTDDQGADAYNRALSLRRAEAVSRVLVDKGFADKDVMREGKGSAFPIADNDSARDRAENRRVEIIVPAQSLAAP